MTWNESFLTLFDRCVAAYQSGNQDLETYYDADARRLLGEIGYKPREFFDFVEDFCDSAVPAISTALLVAAVRRDYFLAVQEGKTSDAPLLTRDALPAFEVEMNGIPYLPRIIAKARAKLRGELDPDLMFSCGGDRRFLTENGDIHPADFLRRVWAAGDDDSKIADWVARQAS